MAKDQQELWAVFAQTGRAEDYLRYRQAVELANAVRINVQNTTADRTAPGGTDKPAPPTV